MIAQIVGNFILINIYIRTYTLKHLLHYLTGQNSWDRWLAEFGLLHINACKILPKLLTMAPIFHILVIYVLMINLF